MIRSVIILLFVMASTLGVHAQTAELTATTNEQAELLLVAQSKKAKLVTTQFSQKESQILVSKINKDGSVVLCYEKQPVGRNR